MQVGELRRLDPAEAARQVAASGLHEDEWLNRFACALDGELRRSQLDRVMSLWGLNGAGAARIFGVTRQAISSWLRDGVPPDRLPALAELAAATDLLSRYVLRDRIPAVVRRPVDRLERRSMIGLAIAGRTAELVELTREMLEFSCAAARGPAEAGGPGARERCWSEPVVAVGANSR